MINFRRVTAVCAILPIIAILAIAPAGCIQNLGRNPQWGKPSTLEFDLAPHVKAPNRIAMVFLCDGLNADVFDEMLRDGQLPHIKHFLVERGTMVDNALGSLPTITYGSITSLVTGVRAGSHGVLGNNWFDPRLLVLRRYGTIGTMSLVNDDFQCPTVFEHLAPEHTVAVTMQHHRGATTWHENWMRTGPAWFFRMFHNVNMTTTARLQNVASEANATGRFPELFLLYYPAPDEVAHLYGIDSDNYRRILRSFDNEVGDACKALQEQGLLERTMLVLVTDHGMARVRQHYDAAAELQLKGIQTTSHAMGQRDGFYQKRSAYFNRFQAVVLPDGSREAAVTVRRAGFPWAYRPSLDDLRNFTLEDDDGRPTNRRLNLIELCLSMPATQLVAYGDRDPDTPRVHLFSADGHAVITRRRTSQNTDEYAYQLNAGRDPLDYVNSATAAPLTGGSFHTADAWAAATLETEHPGLVAEFPAYFQSRRTGDLVLFARRLWDFGNDGNRSGHGGILRQELVTRMIFAGPGIAEGEKIRWACTLSLTPTLIHFLRNERDSQLFRHFQADSLLDILKVPVENASSVTPAPELPDAR